MYIVIVKDLFVKSLFICRIVFMDVVFESATDYIILDIVRLVLALFQIKCRLSISTHLVLPIRYKDVFV